jgi:predicted  nucleic acid-binding Zn-ribbon protein
VSDLESTSAALRRAEQERDRFVAAADKLHGEWLDLKAAMKRVEQQRDELASALNRAVFQREMFRAELDSARQELDAVRKERARE